MRLITSFKIHVVSFLQGFFITGFFLNLPFESVFKGVSLFIINKLKQIFFTIMLSIPIVWFLQAYIKYIVHIEIVTVNNIYIKNYKFSILFCMVF